MALEDHLTADVSRWIDRAITGRAYGSDLVEIMAKWWATSTDAERLLAMMVERGWIRSMGDCPSPSQRFLGVGGKLRFPSHVLQSCAFAAGENRDEAEAAIRKVLAADR